MLVSYISKQQAKNILKIVWDNNYIKKIKKMFIRDGIIDITILIVIYLWAFSMIKLIVLAIVLVRTTQFFTIKYKFQNNTLSLFNKDNQCSVLFVVNNEQTQQKYAKFISDQNIDELTNVYHKKDIPMPNSPNYKIDTDEIFKQLYNKLNLKTILKNCSAVIENHNYLLILSESNTTAKNNTMLYIITKTKNNLQLMNSNELSIPNIKRQVSNYLIINN